MRKDHAQTDPAWLQEAHRRYLAYLRGESAAAPEAAPARAETRGEAAEAARHPELET